MRIAGEFQIEAPIERVWQSFWNEETMRCWIPGCKTARWESSERIVGELQQSVAQLKAVFAFDLKVVENSPPHRIRLRGTGEGVAINSGVVLEMEVKLSEVDAAATHVAYVSQVEISGRLAKAGEVVLKIKAKEVQRLLAQNVKAVLERGNQ